MKLNVTLILKRKGDQKAREEICKSIRGKK